MFWKYNVSCSPLIEAIVAKEDVSLQEVMNSDDIINECRLHNKALIDYLQKPNVMEELVTLTTKEPSIELDERIRFKYSNIACELLTCDVPALNERLASDELLLDKLYNFLDSEPPLNPLLASFFSKILGALIAKKTEQNWLSYQFTCLQVLDFLKAKDTFISLLLKHLGTSAIMDLMLKLFTQVEGIETKQNILNWLDSQQIMQSLVSMLNPNIDKDRHDNAAQLLCDFIRIARDNQGTSMERAEPDPLLNTLESTEIISLLLDKILNGEKCESSIVGGIQVLLALLDVNQNSISKFNSATTYSNLNDESNDMEQKKKALTNISNALVERLADFHDLLLNPPKTTPVVLTTGVLDPPLGKTRLQVLKLFASVISSNNKDLLNKVISLGTFPVMLDLFFKYPWNNFLHTQVERCLVFVLRTYISEDSDDTAIALCKHLLENCKLIDRILEAWNENDEQQKAKGVRKGYMGHIINILNEIINSCSNSYLGQFLKDKYPQMQISLEEFREKTLDDVNKTQRALLGGAHPSNSNNNDSGEFNESSLPQSIAFQQQQMYAEYQTQYVNSRFIEGYSGFNDDTFNDGGDTLQAVDHRTDMNFDLSDNGFAIQVFKQLCSQSINTLDDADDQIFEEKDHTFQTVIEKEDDDGPAYSSITDEDDDSPTDGNVMEVDLWLSSKPESGDSQVTKISTTDPWCNISDNASHAKSDSWADFTSATFEADFSKAFESQFSTNIDNEKTHEKGISTAGKTDSENVSKEKSSANVLNAVESGKASEDIVETSKVENLCVSDTQDNENSSHVHDQEEAAGDQGKKVQPKKEEICEPSMNTSEGDCMSKMEEEQKSTMKPEN